MRLPLTAPMSSPSAPQLPDDGLSSGALLARARAGDAQAFGRLFEAAAPRLALYVRLRLSEGLARQLEVQDVLQETGLAAFDAIGGFEARGRGAFARWLCAIAENRLRDAADHHGALKRTPAGGREAITDVVARVGLSVTGPATAAARDEEHERLREGLEALEPRERQALVLRYFRGATTAQVAHELGSSETAARRLLVRATSRLARELGPELGEAGA